MKVLVINCGSSSLKYQLITTEDGNVITKGLIEKIGGNSEFCFYGKNGEKITQSHKLKDHAEALGVVVSNLVDPAYKFVGRLEEIDAIGHRVVHGGEEFSKSVIIDDRVISSIEKYAELAPLHNPPNLLGIHSCSKVLPGTKQVAVFDTAFHQTMPESSYFYAIPYEYYDKYKIRRYGFHGTSHRYVTIKAAEFLKKDIESFNCITCHLGNGSSITAVKNGKSADTSMGFTPLEGVVMGTRCGTIDPNIVYFLMNKENMNTAQIDQVLNKKSGLAGFSGISNDLREVTAAAKDGNRRAAIARDLLVKSIRRYIGAYMVELGRVDSIIFTAGIGENDAYVREKCVEGLENFGIAMNTEINRLPSIRGQLTDLSLDGSKTRILLVPTNEEYMIAMETAWVINGK